MQVAILIFLIFNFIFNTGFSLMLAMFFHAKAKEFKKNKNSFRR